MKNLLTLRTEKLDELPNRELCDRRHHKSRYPSNKVRRFLQSNVGQRWNDVYSKYLRLDWIPHDLRNLEHIKWHVIIDTFMKDGKVVYIPSFRCAEVPVDHIGGETERYYIDPQTKKLCVVHVAEKKAKENRQRAATKIKTMRVLGDYHQLLKVNGMWIEVKAERLKGDEDLVKIKGLYYKEANVKPVTRLLNGVLLKDIAPADGVKYFIHNGKLYLPAKDPTGYSGWRRALGPRDRIISGETNKPRWMRYNDIDPQSFKIVLQKQLNSKELKRYGLKNDSPQFTQRCKKCGGLIGKDCLYHYCSVCEKPNDDCKCNKW